MKFSGFGVIVVSGYSERQRSRERRDERRHERRTSIDHVAEISITDGSIVFQIVFTEEKCFFVGRQLKTKIRIETSKQIQCRRIDRERERDLLSLSRFLPFELGRSDITGTETIEIVEEFRDTKT